MSFDSAIRAELRPGSRILDIGSGRVPAVPRGWLPQSASYIGLDVSRAELDAAPVGAYDDVVVADVAEDLPFLHGSIDIAVSWQVLEHVRPMRRVLSNIHGYLSEGGLLVASLSGGRSAFALISRLVPYSVARFGLTRLLHRDPGTIFPAHYDSCTASALRKHLASWSEVSIEPIYQAAMYFQFSPALERLYLAFEDRLARGRHENLATHYVVIARK